MCDMDCFNCTRPARKCHGGNRKSAVPWKQSTKTTVGKGNPLLAKAVVSRPIRRTKRVPDDDPNFTVTEDKN